MKHNPILAQLNQECQALAICPVKHLVILNNVGEPLAYLDRFGTLTQDDYDSLCDVRFLNPGSRVFLVPNAVRRDPTTNAFTYQNKCITIRSSHTLADWQAQLDSITVAATLQTIFDGVVTHTIKLDAEVSEDDYRQLVNGIAAAYGEAIEAEVDDNCWLPEQKFLLSSMNFGNDGNRGRIVGGTREPLPLDELETFRRSDRSTVKTVTALEKKVGSAKVDLQGTASLLKKLKENEVKPQTTAEGNVEYAISKLNFGAYARNRTLCVGKEFAKRLRYDGHEDSLDTLFQQMIMNSANRLQELGGDWNAQDLVDQIITGMTDYLNLELEKVSSHTRTITEGKKVNVPYISELNLSETREKFIFVRSPINTGKSTAVGDMIRKLPPHASVVCIDFRVALVNQHVKELGLIRYNRIGSTPLYSVQRLATTVDSVGKLMLGDFDPCRDFIFIDELDSVCHYLLTCTGTSINHARKLVIDTLVMLLRNSERIVCASADLSQLDIDFIKFLGMADESEVLTVINEAKPASKKVVLVPTKDQQLRLAQDKLVSERAKVFFICDKASQAEEIFDTFSHEEYKLNGKLFTKESAQADKEEFAENAEAFCKGLDFVAASPVMGIGVNIDFRYFDYVFALFSYPELGYRDCLQMMGRVRNPISNTIYVWENTNVNAKCVEEDWLKECNRLEDEAILESFFTLDYSSPNPKPSRTFFSKIIDFQYKYIRRNVMETINRKSKMIAALKDEGHEVSEYEDEQAPKLTFKGSSAAFRAKECKSIADANNITNAQAYKLRRTEIKTRKEEHELEKFDIAAYLGIEQNELTADLVNWFKYGVGENAMRAKQILTWTSREAYERDLDNLHEREGWQGLGAEYNQKKREALKAVKIHIDKLVELGLYDDNTDFSELMYEVNVHAQELKELGINRPRANEPIRTVNALLNLFMIPYFRATGSGKGNKEKRVTRYVLNLEQIPLTDLQKQLQVVRDA